jgi:hypothetical protein
MSPARIFDVEPLSRITFKERLWMTKLLHERWSSSSGLHELMMSTIEAISAIDKQYEILSRRLTSVLELSGDPNLCRQATQYHSFPEEPLVQCAEIFYRRCYILSELLSRFPSDSGFGWIDQLYVSRKF